MSARSLWKNVFTPLLVLAVAQTIVVAQYTTQEYAAYETAINADPAKREDAIIEFIETNPRSTLVEYAIGSYLQLMQEYQNQGQSRKVFDAGEKLLALKPDELNTLYMTAISAYQLQLFTAATTYGEKVYVEKPNAGLAFVLASSYGQLKNEEKQLEYGDKACAELSPKDCYQILSALAKIYAGRKEWAKASEYAERTTEGLDAAERPSQTPESEWNEYLKTERATAYTIVGREAAEHNNWNTAISNYAKVLKLTTDPALNGEAYYYTGMGQWEHKQMDSAMEAFAKGSVQRGAPHAKHCRQYLETLYKSSHNGSLAGLEEFIERVTR
ncbi:MAG: hypothetical protein IH790_04985 [Acidobacteria bacterium]|nr:hypothetical protein [Acidobacteriota bacterium]